MYEDTRVSNSSTNKSNETEYEGMSLNSSQSSYENRKQNETLFFSFEEFEPNQTKETNQAHKIINCKLGSIIGRGSFGTVNLCYALNRKQTYAVKHVSLNENQNSSNFKKVTFS